MLIVRLTFFFPISTWMKISK